MSKPYVSKSSIVAYPHCAGRGILDTFADGVHGGPTRSQFRVHLGKLLQSFNDHERAKWDRLSILPRQLRDEHGMFPDVIEKFLSTLPRRTQSDAAPQPAEDAAMAATATKKKAVKKRPASKRATKKAAPKKKAAAKASANGKPAAKVAKSAGGAKFDAAQKPLPGMEDVKVQSVETCIKKIVTAEAAQAAAKDEHDAEVARLPGLFKKHGLAKYAAHGRSVSIKPGVDKVVIQKVKDK